MAGRLESSCAQALFDARAVTVWNLHAIRATQRYARACKIRRFYSRAARTSNACEAEQINMGGAARAAGFASAMGAVGIAHIEIIATQYLASKSRSYNPHQRIDTTMIKRP
jgi:hypothetical protein